MVVLVKRFRGGDKTSLARAGDRAARRALPVEVAWSAQAVPKDGDAPMRRAPNTSSRMSILPSVNTSRVAGLARLVHKQLEGRTNGLVQPARAQRTDAEGCSGRAEPIAAWRRFLCDEPLALERREQAMHRAPAKPGLVRELRDIALRSLEREGFEERNGAQDGLCSRGGVFAHRWTILA